MKNFLDVSGNLKVRCKTSDVTITETTYGDRPGWTIRGQEIGSSVYNARYGWSTTMNGAGTIFAWAPRYDYNPTIQVYEYNASTDTWNIKGNSFPTWKSNSIHLSDAGTRLVRVEAGDSPWVHVYDYNSGTNTWGLTSEVRPTQAADPQTGGALSGDGNTIAMGKYSLLIYRVETTGITLIGELDENPYTGAIHYGPALSYDGNRVTVTESSYNSNQGRVTVYDYSGSGTTWNQVGDAIIGPTTNSYFGSATSLSHDGNTLVVTSLAGAVYAYTYDGSQWVSKGNPITGPAGVEQFGTSAKVSGDGNTIVSHDMYYDGWWDSTGAVFVFEYVNGDWSQVSDRINYDTENSGHGYMGGDHERPVRNESLAISNNGQIIAVGTPHAHWNGRGLPGRVAVFENIAEEFTTTTIIPGTDSGINVSNGTITMVANTLDVSSGVVDISGTSWMNRGQSSATIADAYQCGLVIESSTTSTDDAVLYVETAGQAQAFSVRGDGATYADNILEHSSDDRRKINEQHITNATETIMKLSPQIYTKLDKFEAHGGKPIKTESGLIAQDIYYNAPELQHLVSITEKDSYGKVRVPIDIDWTMKYLTLAEKSHKLLLEKGLAEEELSEEFKKMYTNDISGNDLSGNDIQNDPDYTALNWGNKTAYVNYIGLIPYLIKSTQEQNALISERQTMIDQQKELIQQFQDRLTALENK